MKAKSKSVGTFGMKEVEVTIAELQAGYIPSLMEIGHMPLPGNIAYAVAKNFRMAAIVEAQFDKERSMIFRAHCKLNADGSLETEMRKERAGDLQSRSVQVPVFLSPEHEIECKRKTHELHTQKKFKLHLIKVDEELMAGIETIKPVIIDNLRLMLNMNDPEVTNETDHVQQSSGQHVPETDGRPVQAPDLRVSADEHEPSSGRVLHLPNSGPGGGELRTPVLHPGVQEDAGPDELFGEGVTSEPGVQTQA